VKKISYTNKAPEVMPKIDPKDMPSPHVGEEGLSGDTSAGGGRGFTSPADPVWPPTHSDQEDEPVFPERPKPKNTGKIDYEELTNLLVGLADDMDKQEDMALANFADFLIKKIAVQKSLDYSLLFRDLLVKIVESDIANHEEVLIKLTKQFNELLKMYVDLGNSLADSKREAYQGSALKAEEYVKKSG